MFQTAVLASGSKGNCTLVRTDETAVLFDCGISFKRICEALHLHSLSPQLFEAVVISHEHSDHINGIGPLSRKLKIPVFITKPTYEMSLRRFVNTPSDVIFFNPGDHFTIGDLEIHPFPSSHDAIDACNFTVTQQKKALTEEKKQQKLPQAIRKLAIATDLGYCSKLLINKIQDATTIILESNHDMEMLVNGIYPWHLKQRVKGRNGHLSNDQAIGLLSQIIHPALDNIILAHLSEENNNPSLVEKVFTEYFSAICCNIRFTISSQRVSTPLFDV